MKLRTCCRPPLGTITTWRNDCHPDAPEFAGIKANLARLFIEHKADMAMADAPDAWIITHVNDVTATLWFLSRTRCSTTATRRGCVATIGG